MPPDLIYTHAPRRGHVILVVIPYPGGPTRCFPLSFSRPLPGAIRDTNPDAEHDLLCVPGTVLHLVTITAGELARSTGTKGIAGQCLSFSECFGEHADPGPAMAPFATVWY